MISSRSSPPKKRSGGKVLMRYAEDHALFDPCHYSVCEQGMHLRTNWRFAIGTELGLDVTLKKTARARAHRVHCHGVVVACQKVRRTGCAYDVTLLFLHPPKDLRNCLRKASCHIRIDP
ncbi:MAG: hypothetical protein SFY92_06020 [Verrucomicrobiae bacterium]|nr:hypothetical protein [Verrucomicrobiae bacterium]